MNMKNYLNQLIAFLFAASALLATFSVQANDAASGKEAVIVLQKRTLPDAPGKKVIVAIVNYAPGQASFGHAHPGSVVAYVLEGAVVSQVKGEEPVTYKTGDSWYESPRIPHVVSRNASNTEPAKLLVWMLSNEEEGIKVPIDK
ncbi:MAG: cupin domain-containing protein [Nitrosospira sp.]